jgi:hypothetical protein
MIKPVTLMTTNLSKSILDGALSEEQLKCIEKLEEHPLFTNLVMHLENNSEKWVKFINASNPEEVFPDIGGEI